MGKHITDIDRKNILVIATGLTHRTKPRGIQCEYVLKDVIKYYNIIILTNERCGESYLHLREIYPDAVDIIISKSFFPTSLSILLSKMLGKLFSPFRNYNVKFAHCTKAIIKQIKSRIKIDLILSFSTPFSDHLLALNAKRILPNVPWLGFFSDPIEEDSFLKNNIERYFLKYIEKKIVANADKIICPSYKMVKVLNGRYHFQKANYIPHMFTNYREMKEVRGFFNAPVIFRHIGGLYGERSPKCILEALNTIEGSSLVENNYIFEFIGNVESKYKKMINNYAKQNPKVRYISSVSLEKAEKLAIESDCLVVIDVNIKNSSFFPSKIVEYFSFRKPILGITTKNSEVERVLLLTGHKVAYFEDKDSIVKSLIYFSNHHSNNYNYIDYRNIEKFKGKNIFEKWHVIINSLIKN